MLLGPVAFGDPGIFEYCNRLQHGQHVVIISPHPTCKSKRNQRDIMVLWGSFLTERQRGLRTSARKFSNIDFFLKILPLKDDELVMSEMYKKLGSPTSFWREHARKNA